MAEFPEIIQRSSKRTSALGACALIAFALCAFAGDALAAIGVNKTFNPTNVSAGQSSTLTVILINNNPVAATGAAFTDNLPGSVVVANPTNAANSCGGTVTAVPGSASFSFSGGTIPAASGGVAGQCTIQVDVMSATPGVYINTIPANAVSSSQGNNAQQAQATLTVAALRNVTGTKAFAPTNLHGNGNPSTITITITNPNGVQLTGMAFPDNLPAGLAIAPAPNASTTCGAGTVTANPGATSASLAGGTIPANGSCNVKFDVVASNPNAFVNGNVTNSIAGNTITTNEGVHGGDFSAAVRLQTGASISKAFAPTPITTGGTSTLTITINDFNASALTPLNLTDTLPSNANGNILIANPPNVTTSASCGAPTVTAVAGTNTITVAGGSLAGVAVNAGITNTTCTITVNVVGTNTAVNPLTLTNTIPAGNFGGVNYAAASGNLVINQVTSVSGSKAFAPNTVVQGGTSTLTVTLNNSAAVPATLTSVFTDSIATMGAGYTIAAAPPASMTCGGTLTANPGATSFSIAVGGSIPAAGSCTITVPIQVAANAVTGGRTNTIAQGALVTNQGRTQSAITAVLTTTAALTVAKAFVPVTVAAGADSRLTVTLTHANGAPSFSGMQFTDTLPAGYVVSSNPNVANTCGGSVTANSGAGSFSLAGGALGTGATSCTISVNITTPASAGTSGNTIAAGAVTTTEGFVNAAAASASSTRVITNVTVNKSLNPATVLVGGVSTMTINILNNNANALALTSAALTDNLPLGMTVANPPTITNTCGGAVTAVAGSSTVSLANGSIAANGTCQITVHVVASASGNLINTLPAGAFTSAQGVTNPLAASATLAATGTADLAISKTVAGAPIPGTSVTYTIVVSNAGPNDVAGATVVDNQPANITFTSWSCAASAGAACGNASGSGSINETVTVNKNATVTYTVTALINPSATGMITNTATVTPPGTVIDPTPANNTSSVTITLTPMSTLTLSKTGPASVPAGTSFSYTLLITNTGPSDANGSIVTDPAVANFAATGVSCTGTTNGAVCPASPTVAQLQGAGVVIPTLPATGTVTLSLTGTAGPSGSITNSATATPPAGTPGTGSATTPITLSPPTLTKTIVPGTITSGGTATLTLTLGNPNAVVETLTAAFTDGMPPGVTITAGNSGTCPGVTNTPTQITMASGSAIPASGSCTIIVTITSSTPGIATNTTGTLQTTAGNAGPASATLTVNAAAPTLAKTIVPGTIAVGGSATLTLTLGNPNAVAETLTSAFTDGMPPGVTITAGNSGTCPGVTNTPTQITMASGSALPASGSCTIIVTITSSTPGIATNTTGTLQTTAGNAGPASASLTVTAVAPTLAKTIVPGTITAGGNATLTLTLTNPNAVAETLTSDFVDGMPPGVTITAGNSGTCPGVTNTPTQITMASGSAIPASGSCTIIVTITSSTPGTVTNTTGPLQTTAGNAGPASAPLTVNAAAPTLTKTIIPGTITAGGSATLTLTLSNPNAVVETLTAAFTDGMPGGVTITAGNSGTCPGVTNTPTLITMASGSAIPASGSCTIIVTITSSTPGSVTNTTGPLQTTAGNAGPASASLTVNAAAPTLAKTIVPGTITAGGSATLTLTLGNPNAVAETLTSAFTDGMPPGVTITAGNSGTCPGVTNTPTQITMASGSALPASGSCTIIVTITSSTPGSVTNTTGPLQTTAGNAGPASAPLTVNAAAPTLTKTIVPGTITAGGSATLTLTLGNPNAVAATLTSDLIDGMPGGVTITAGNSGTCPGVTNTPTQITMASGSAIPASGSCTIIVSITSSTPGTVTNTTGPLQTTAGNAGPASAPLTVNAAAPTLTKTIVPGTITAGGSATLTLTLGNPNAVVETLTAAFTDGMPPGVTITAGNSGTCPGVTNTPTQIMMASGSALPASGSCTIIVTITSSTPGSVTNTTGPLQTTAGNAGPASAPLTVNAAAPTLTKTIVPGTITAGGSATLTLTLGNPNAGAETLTSAFTDGMPPGVTITAGNSGTCPGVTNTPTQITMASGSALPASGSCTIIVTITSSTPGTVTNTTGPLQTTAGNAAPANASLTVNAAAPTLAKTVVPGTITAGGSATLTLTLGNPNAVVETLTSDFVDGMPSGVTITAGNSGTCPGVTNTPTQITMASGSALSASGSCTIIVTITSSTPGIATNTTGTLQTTAGNAGPASATLTVNAATPTLTKSIVPGTINAGGTATLTLTLGNPNAVAETLTSAFTDGMPLGVTITAGNSGTCPGVTNTPTQITMASGSAIPASGNCTIIVTITSSTPGTVTNTTGPLQTTAGNAGPASAPLTINGPPSVAKAFAPTTINVGATSTLTITITNPNPSATTLNSAFTDSMPIGVTIVGSVAGTCAGVTNTPNLITWASGSTLPAAPGCTITATVTSSTPGTATNQTSTLQTGFGTGAFATAQLTVNPASLQVTKDDGQTSYVPGGNATYLIVVTNNGPSDANSVTVNDPLPGGVKLSGAVTCVAAGTANCGTPFGTAGQSTAGTNGASVPAGAANSITLSVPVTFNSSLNVANLTNTATAKDPASPDASASDTDTRSAQVTLKMTKDDGSNTYTPGGTAIYVVTIIDTDLSDALDVLITDSLPSNVTLTAAVTCAATGTAQCGIVVGPAGGSGFTATHAVVPAGPGNMLTFNVPVAFASSLTANPLDNTVNATDVSGATASATDSDTLSANVTLSVFKTDNSATYTPGGTGTYVVTVTNGGISDATNVTVDDPLPPLVTLSAPVTCVASGNASCGAPTGGGIGGTSFGATGAFVGAGGASSIVFTAKVNFDPSLAVSPLDNTATALDLVSNKSGSSTDSDTRAPSVTLVVNKDDGSLTYTPGGTAIYTVTVSNSGVSDALNVTVSDALPMGLTLTGNATCAATGAAACGSPTGTTGQTSFGTTGARIDAGAGNLLTFMAPVAFAPNMIDDPLINTATATDLASNATASGQDSDKRAGKAVLSVTKDDGNATYTPGGNATYTIIVTNAGPSDALDVNINDTLPGGVTLSANATCTPTGSANCGAFTGTSGSSTVTATGASIAAGAANSLTITIPVAYAPSLTTNPLVNQVTVDDPDAPAPVTASDSDTVAYDVKLKVTKDDGSPTYVPGGTATYVVTIINNGASDAANVTITDPLPAGVTLSANATCVPSGSASCGVVSGTAGQTSFGATGAKIPAGAANALTFTVPVNFAAGLATDPLVNTATAQDVPSGATASGSDSDARTTSVSLAVTKTDNSPTYTPGGTATYIVRVTNGGLTDAVNVTLTDPLPAGVTLSAPAACVPSGTSQCGTVTGSTGQTSFSTTGARVNAGAGNALTFTAPVFFSASLTTSPLINSVTVTDVATGATASASDSDTLAGGGGNLAVTKTDNSATYTPGGAATYIIKVTNAGPSDALNTTVSDPLPAGVTLTANVTCTAAGAASCGTVTGSASGTTFGTTGAKIPAGAANSLTFTAPVAFAASLTTDPLVNTVTVSDPSSPTRTASDSDARNAASGLNVTKTDNSATYTPGGTATYIITVTNAGPADALNVTVTDPLPAGVTLTANVTCAAAGAASCGTVNGSAGGTSFGATGAKIPVGAANSLTFTVPVAFAATMTTNPLVNTVTVSDPSSPTRTASDSDTLSAVADVGIAKTGPVSVAPNGQITWKLTITNAGPSSANGATFSDTLPSGMSSISASCGNATGGAVCGTLNVIGQTVSGSVAVLPPGGSVVITILAVAPASGTLVNTASVATPAGVVDPNPQNQMSSFSTEISGGGNPDIPVPVDAGWMLAALSMLLLGTGWRHCRARRR